MSTTPYERLSGGRRIAEIVDNFRRQSQVRAPRPVQIEQAKRHVTEFFCAGAGGPQPYTGKDLLTTHKGMNISEKELIAAIDDPHRTHTP